MNTKIKILALIGLCCIISVSVGEKREGTTIQDGILTYSYGHYLYPTPIPLGFDPYGYNYQGHMQAGSYANVYLGRDGFPPYEGDDDAYYQRLVDEGFATDIVDAEAQLNSKWYWPYRDVDLLMKWNDAWLSNMDRDKDGSLDRHYGYDSYIGSSAWETNHQSGSYEVDGITYNWSYFVKIVAVPADATNIGGIWYTADGIEIGPVIWGQFAIIMQVYNDTGTGEHGPMYLSPAGPGFGQY